RVDPQGGRARPVHPGQERIAVSYLEKMFDLTGRVAIVTGGSRGLGREIAFGCAYAGADVVIASRKLDACERTAAEIEKATGRQAMPYALHVGRWDQIEPFG